MRKTLSFVLAIAALLGAVGTVRSTYAAAKDANWLVSVTYQNVGSGNATISMSFYSEGSGSPSATINPLPGNGTLAPGAGASLFIGSVAGIESGFQGSAVVLANQPLVATVVQFSNDPGFKMRLISNGFQGNDASNRYLVATTMRNGFGNRTTVFSIQNTESVATRATVKFYDSATGNLAATVQHVIPPQSSKYIDMSDPADTGLAATVTQFNGSAVITAVRDGSTTAARVVSAASEYYTDRNIGANFEGVPLDQASPVVYMATALCEQFGLDTFYAVQNADQNDDAFITVTYRGTDGKLKATDGPYKIGPGQKKSIITCDPNSGRNMAGFTGSATIRSTSTATGDINGAPIVAIGKASSSVGAPSAAVGPDVYTAFLGEPSGSSEVSLPFIRWVNDAVYFDPANLGARQRTAIAVQNLEEEAIKVDVKYFDKAGRRVATQRLTIPAFSKGNSNPASAKALDSSGQFGYYNDGTFGGAVTVEAVEPASAEFIAIARAQNPGAGEDYNGVGVGD